MVVIVRSLIRMGVITAVLVLMSMSVRACQSLPQMKLHPVYDLVAEQGSRLPAID